MSPSEAIGLQRKQPTVPFTYFTQVDAPPFAIKIAMSDSPLLRVKKLQAGNPHRLKIVGMVRAYSVLEGILHRAFANEKIRGDWFRPDSQLLDLIRQLKERRVGELLTAQQFDELCAELIRKEIKAGRDYRAAERIFQQQRRGAKTLPTPVEA